MENNLLVSLLISLAQKIIKWGNFSNTPPQRGCGQHEVCIYVELRCSERVGGERSKSLFAWQPLQKKIWNFRRSAKAWYSNATGLCHNIKTRGKFWGGGAKLLEIFVSSLHSLSNCAHRRVLNTLRNQALRSANGRQFEVTVKVGTPHSQRCSYTALCHDSS